MEDKGEKIVFLARELLEAQALEIPLKKKTMNVTLTLKTLCFTTFLAAASGSVISTYVHEQNRPINKYEKIELRALIFYAAKLRNISEDILRQEVETRFDIGGIENITTKEFPEVRRFLQEKAR